MTLTTTPDTDLICSEVNAEKFSESVAISVAAQNAIVRAISKKLNSHTMCAVFEANNIVGYARSGQSGSRILGTGLRVRSFSNRQNLKIMEVLENCDHHYPVTLQNVAHEKDENGNPLFRYSRGVQVHADLLGLPEKMAEELKVTLPTNILIAMEERKAPFRMRVTAS